MNKDFIKGMSIGCAFAVVAGSTLVFAEPVRHNIEAVYNDIKIIVHGKTATPSNGEPFIYDGTTYLPVRAVAEALGEVVDWDGSTNTVYIGTERPVATPTPTPLSASTKDGDDGLAAADIESWEHYTSRENITVSWDDSSRPRLKAGDTFIAEDGTAYLLEIGPSGVLGEGLPIATDLGRSITVKGQTMTITDGYKPGISGFGWIREGLATSGRKYLVNPNTGEGHFDAEWSEIRKHTRPSYTGSDGQLSEDGNWKYYEMLGSWEFVIAF